MLLKSRPNHAAFRWHHDVMRVGNPGCWRRSGLAPTEWSVAVATGSETRPPCKHLISLSSATRCSQGSRTVHPASTCSSLQRRISGARTDTQQHGPSTCVNYCLRNFVVVTFVWLYAEHRTFALYLTLLFLYICHFVISYTSVDSPLSLSRTPRFSLPFQNLHSSQILPTVEASSVDCRTSLVDSMPTVI